MPAEAALEFAGRQLLLLAERALWWPAQRALLVADVHLGKGGVFRAHGLAVPSGSTRADLDRLSALIRRFRCEHLIVLGDLVHGRPSARLLAQVAEWRDAHPRLHALLVRGNHDRHLGPLPEAWAMRELPGHELDGVRLAHAPEAGGSPQISGHLHPACRLAAGRADSLRVPVFWVRPQSLVLPAFGSFTGGQTVRPAARDRVFAVGPGLVTEVAVG